MLTPEQITQMRAKAGLAPINQSSQSANNNYVGRFDYLLRDKKPDIGIIDKIKTGAKNVMDETQKNMEKIADTYSQQQNLPNAMLSSTAIAPKFIADIIFEGIKTVMPDNVKEEVKKHIADLMSNPTVQKDLVEPLMKLSEKYPQSAQAVKDITDIASILPAPKVAEVGSKVISEGVDSAGKILVKAGEGTGKTVLKLAEDAKNIANKGMDKATDIISPIDKGVETVLNKPTTKLEKLSEYEKVAKDALLDYSKPTPLELAGNKAGEALTSLQGQLKSAGESKKAITQSMSSVNTGNIVNDAKNEMRSLLKDRTGLQFTEKGGFKNAPGRLSTVSDKADLELVKNIDFKLSQLSKNPTFQKVDDAIDWMHDLLYKRNGMTAVPINGKVEGIIKNVVKNLNDNLKIIGGKDYSAFNSAYSTAKSTFDKLNKALGVEGNKGASLMKQLFSPTGTAPRKLFEDIKNLTGIDLVDEATLAKFVMENVGDVRQASLLEQVIKGNVPTNAKSLIQMAAEKTIGKLQNPIEKAKRIIGRSK